MADYKKMYTLLFNNITDAIELLQEAQLESEEIFIQDDDNISLIPPIDEI